MNTPDPKLELPQKIIRMARKLPTNESLSILISYVEELKADYEMKREYMKENESQKNRKEYDIQLIEHLIENKREEIETEKLQLQCITSTEGEWKERVKMAQKSKFTSMEEYMTKMRDLRKQIELLVVGVDNEIVQQEIEKLKQSKEGILREIHNCREALNAIENAVLISNRDVECYIDSIKLVNVSIGDIVNETEVKGKEDEIAALDHDIKSLQSLLG